MISPSITCSLGEPALDEHSLIEFARACLMPILGETLGCCFFLAGGAFKSLLHGHPPRDLDLWPATDADRAILVEQLTSRGARLLSDNPPFQTTYSFARKIVELPYDTSPTSLEERLARSDIALSAVGVEHRHGTWRAVIHPLALESIRRREVLLLKPLVNWKYALATLGRMHRYAVELGYSVPDSEPPAVWSVFDAQHREEQEAMLARYLRVAPGDPRVLMEAQCRLRP
jgi:hypothetical protein